MARATTNGQRSADASLKDGLAARSDNSQVSSLALTFPPRARNRAILLFPTNQTFPSPRRMPALKAEAVQARGGAEGPRNLVVAELAADVDVLALLRLQPRLRLRRTPLRPNPPRRPNAAPRVEAARA